jgi:hypothetical protein
MEGMNRVNGGNNSSTYHHHKTSLVRNSTCPGGSVIISCDHFILPSSYKYESVQRVESNFQPARAEQVLTSTTLLTLVYTSRLLISDLIS